MRNMIKDYFICSQLQNQYEHEALHAQPVIELQCLVYLNSILPVAFLFFKKTTLPKIEALGRNLLDFFLGLSLLIKYVNETDC